MAKKSAPMPPKGMPPKNMGKMPPKGMPMHDMGNGKMMPGAKHPMPMHEEIHGKKKGKK